MAPALRSDPSQLGSEVPHTLWHRPILMIALVTSLALRHLGAARTAAYFSTAPFVGALVAILWLVEPLSLQFVVAAFLMGAGV